MMVILDMLLFFLVSMFCACLLLYGLLWLHHLPPAFWSTLRIAWDRGKAWALYRLRA